MTNTKPIPRFEVGQTVKINSAMRYLKHHGKLVEITEVHYHDESGEPFFYSYSTKPGDPVHGALLESELQTVVKVKELKCPVV